jgi:hypothetical protein
MAQNAAASSNADIILKTLFIGLTEPTWKEEKRIAAINIRGSA